jgi:hypothetical protein
MSHPHPHMQHYPPIMNPYPHPGFPTDYSGPPPMQYHHPMGMAPPGYVYPGYPQGPQQPPMQMMMPVQNNGSVAPTPPTSEIYFSLNFLLSITTVIAKQY